ncbi:type II toxin-antitoxin system HigA family antitoxin [Aquimarina sp. AU119]|uniref:helix-turn-helix domain-containing protein n=1 Tax=Aquimarina sp. AU119 TaxID=2108528 RepID=UPI000D69F037|nr:transcriptional regulator [Aquimarina sp. AU119]
MKIKVLKTEQDYQEAITLLEEIGDDPNFENNPKLIDEFELLEKLVTDYENEKFPIEKGDPIEIIKLKMNYMNWKQKDLIPIIGNGSKGIVSEVMNKKRGLSKAMIRNLSKHLGLNQEILNTPYDLIKDKKTKTIATAIEDTSVFNPFNFDKQVSKCINSYSNRVRKNGMLLNV